MNENRRQIVISDEAWKFYRGPILVLSGPGTGKTFQLAKRIKFLTKTKGVSRDEITVITFTKEAARSMRKKISDPEGKEYIEPSKRPSRISTMHSLGNWIIKENYESLNLTKNFKVVTSERLKELLMIDAALLVGKKESSAEELLSARSKSKAIPKNLVDIAEKYEEILRKNDSIDYDDQIALACKLLGEDKELRRKYSKLATHLLVDEYQDINAGQFEFIKLLSSSNRAGLFVVGDDDQSIYSFRGGSPTYIRNFLDDFGSKSKIIKMKTSRRCPKNILSCANTLINKFNVARLKKPKPKYLKKETGKVVTHNCPSDDKEAYIIANLIRNHIPNKSVYILVPNKLYLEKIKKALRKVGVSFNSPFYIRGSGLETFGLVKEWLDNPESNFATRLCIDALIEANTTAIPSSRSKTLEKKKLRLEGLRFLGKLWERVICDNLSYFESLNNEAKQNSLLKSLTEKLNKISQLKEDQLSEFLQVIVQDMRLWTKKSLFLQEVTNWIEELKYQSSGTSEYEVRILTMQGAKGLQADIICVVGLEETNFPKATNSQGLEEESRLFFVSMTRARDELHLFHSRKRSGSITFQKPSFNLKPSRFITCLPSKIVEDKRYFF